MPDFCAPATMKSSRSTLWRLIPSTSPIVIPLRLDVYRDEFCNHRSWTAVLAINGSWLGEIGISRAHGRRICDRSHGDSRSRRHRHSRAGSHSQALACPQSGLCPRSGVCFVLVSGFQTCTFTSVRPTRCEAAASLPSYSQPAISSPTVHFTP